MREGAVGRLAISSGSSVSQTRLSGEMAVGGPAKREDGKGVCGTKDYGAVFEDLQRRGIFASASMAYIFHPILRLAYICLQSSLL